MWVCLSVTTRPQAAKLEPSPKLQEFSAERFWSCYSLYISVVGANLILSRVWASRPKATSRALYLHLFFAAVRFLLLSFTFTLVSRRLFDCYSVILVWTARRRIAPVCRAFTTGKCLCLWNLNCVQVDPLIKTI